MTKYYTVYIGTYQEYVEAVFTLKTFNCIIILEKIR